jgi:hypothetical protein
MFIERKLNPSTGLVELWKCEWGRPGGAPAKKMFLDKIGDEQPLAPSGQNTWSKKSAICWAYGRTLGNIAVFSEAILGEFEGATGDDALLPCDFVNAGKYRNGVNRWWCRTHQTHWGTKGDLSSYDKLKEMRCANHTQLMNYVVNPLELNFNDFAEVAIWCSLPAALSTQEIVSRKPKIHVHLRKTAGDKFKKVDKDYDAISLLYNEDLGLFANEGITRVNVTPPAAFEFVSALEEEREMDCIGCSKCGFPHLDLGSFAREPHRKHFCGNCGWDSTWSKRPIVSTPLKPLHDKLAKSKKFKSPDRTIDLDKHKGCDYTVWASTPAILWTAEREQEKGIHVHVEKGGVEIENNTFGEVILNGKALDRKKLLQGMFKKTTM